MRSGRGPRRRTAGVPAGTWAGGAPWPGAGDASGGPSQAPEVRSVGQSDQVGGVAVVFLAGVRQPTPAGQVPARQISDVRDDPVPAVVHLLPALGAAVRRVDLVAVGLQPLAVEGGGVGGVVCVLADDEGIAPAAVGAPGPSDVQGAFGDSGLTGCPCALDAVRHQASEVWGWIQSTVAREVGPHTRAPTPRPAVRPPPPPATAGSAGRGTCSPRIRARRGGYRTPATRQDCQGGRRRPGGGCSSSSSAAPGYASSGSCGR